MWNPRTADQGWPKLTYPWSHMPRKMEKVTCVPKRDHKESSVRFARSRAQARSLLFLFFQSLNTSQQLAVLWVLREPRERQLPLRDSA